MTVHISSSHEAWQLTRFARQQSAYSRSCEWVDRERPVRGWGWNVLNGVGFALFCVAVFVLVGV